MDNVVIHDERLRLCPAVNRLHALQKISKQDLDLATATYAADFNCAALQRSCQIIFL